MFYWITFELSKWENFNLYTKFLINILQFKALTYLLITRLYERYGRKIRDFEWARKLEYCQKKNKKGKQIFYKISSKPEKMILRIFLFAEFQRSPELFSIWSKNIGYKYWCHSDKHLVITETTYFLYAK